jgi:hypothetical protein
MERSAGRREGDGTDIIRRAHQTLRGLLQDLGIEWKAFLASMQDEGRHVPSYTFLRQPRLLPNRGQPCAPANPRPRQVYVLMPAGRLERC